MQVRIHHLLFCLILAAALSSAAAAQSADNRDMFPRARPEETPKNVKEMLSKMQIEQAKKEHAELLEKGDELLALTGQLERSVAANGHLGPRDIEKLEDVEKLVKKIRGDLGGDDDDDDPEAKLEQPRVKSDGIRSLRKRAIALVDELKKTSRFSISAVAIQSSNSVLRLVRFIRTGR
jgi:hypothetical protein